MLISCPKNPWRTFSLHNTLQTSVVDPNHRHGSYTLFTCFLPTTVILPVARYFLGVRTLLPTFLHCWHTWSSETHRHPRRYRWYCPGNRPVWDPPQHPDLQELLITLWNVAPSLLLFTSDHRTAFRSSSLSVPFAEFSMLLKTLLRFNSGCHRCGHFFARLQTARKEDVKAFIFHRICTPKLCICVWYLWHNRNRGYRTSVPPC